MIPATNIGPQCPASGSAISDDWVSLDYTICLTYTFDQPMPSPYCDDGNPNTINDMWNGDCECEGIVQTNSCDVLIASDDFESGLGNWNDGGADCVRIGYAATATSGIYTVNIQDNTASSVVTSDAFDLSEYNSISVAFNYYAIGMESNEDFWLQISTDGGTSFSTMEDWKRGVDFENNTHYAEQLEIEGPFSANTVLRFRCDASTNGDDIYLDDIVINGCSSVCTLVNQPCDDGDSCTTNDVFDSDCVCLGTFQDEDNDGICDSDDICPLGDDTVDSDVDGIPDACDPCIGDCPTEVNFSSTYQSLDEGSQVLICVDIADPKPNLPTTVTLSMSSTHGQLHFPDFVTPTELMFPAGSSEQKCLTFTIPHAADPAMTYPYYTYYFFLGNSNDNNHSVTVGSNSTMNISVDPIRRVSITTPGPIEAVEGSTVEVCVEASGAYQTGVSTSLRVVGNAAPHLSNMSLWWLYFPARPTSTVCHTLDIPVVQDAQSNVYTLALDYVYGGIIDESRKTLELVVIAASDATEQLCHQEFNVSYIAIPDDLDITTLSPLDKLRFSTRRSSQSIKEFIDPTGQAVKETYYSSQENIYPKWYQRPAFSRVDNSGTRITYYQASTVGLPPKPDLHEAYDQAGTDRYQEWSSTVATQGFLPTYQFMLPTPETLQNLAVNGIEIQHNDKEICASDAERSIIWNEEDKTIIQQYFEEGIVRKTTTSYYDYHSDLDAHLLSRSVAVIPKTFYSGECYDQVRVTYYTDYDTQCQLSPPIQGLQGITPPAAAPSTAKQLSQPTEALVLAPNPAYDQLQVTVSVVGEQAATVTITSLAGSTLLMRKLDPGQQTLDFSVAALPAGIYLVQWQAGDQFSSSKFVKH